MEHALTQRFCLPGAVFFFQLLSKRAQLVNRARDTPPGDVLQQWVALAVDAERRVVLSLDKPVPSLVSVATPGLYGQRDVCVGPVLGRTRLVCLFNHGIYDVRLVQAPQDQRLEEVELRDVSRN